VNGEKWKGEQSLMGILFSFLGQAGAGKWVQLKLRYSGRALAIPAKPLPISEIQSTWE
jgi:hypothetical protein